MGFMSKDNFTSCLKFSDKFLHMIYGFAGFVFLGFYTQWPFIAVFAVVIAVGIILELLQVVFADGFSSKDLIADITGCILAWIWVNNPKNIWVFIVILGIYLYVEGIPRLRGKR